MDSVTYQGSGRQSKNDFYAGPTIVLAVNAIDGSIVDIELGY